MSDNMTLFCPRIGGPCIKHKCMAYREHVVYTVVDLPMEAVHLGNLLQMPITLDVDTEYCLFYDVSLNGSKINKKLNDAILNLGKEYTPEKIGGIHQKMKEHGVISDADTTEQLKS